MDTHLCSLIISTPNLYSYEYKCTSIQSVHAEPMQASCREKAGDNVQEINTHPIIAVNMYLYSSLVCHILIDIQF